MSSPKVIFVINEQDEIIEKVPADGTNSTEQRALEKAIKKRYADAGQTVKVRCAYQDVDPALYAKTKELLQKAFADYPEMGHMFEKDTPEGVLLGYEIKPEFKYKNYKKRKKNENR